ncbi:hypothetical protein DFH07DRAFT_939915 [Mycena maculata]|uniref:Uncharacterized protein n=1 Tax=Mycena maculata TaxID=230809 RepID=A0AAD7JCA0_9AGAR|nr:hypothetical protein DFH07DRAFT_939915 [Mycena maculata]
MHHKINRYSHCMFASLTPGEEPSPQKTHRAKAPLLKVLRTETNNQKDDGDESETNLFQTRWTPAEEPDYHAQLQDSALKQETESDRAHRDELMALIKRTSGFSVDKSRLQFECVKDLHPFRDPLRTRHPHSPPLLWNTDQADS